MWIRNKAQNTIWNITDKAQIKRLLAEPDKYEEVKAPAEVEKMSQGDKQPAKAGK